MKPSDISGFPTDVQAQIKRQTKTQTQQTKRGEPEHKLQCAAINFFRYKYPKLKWRLFSIPNGDYKHARVAKRHKDEGELAGVWDLFLSVTNVEYSGLFIETKISPNGLTDNQQKFREANKDDYKFLVYKDTVDGFANGIKEYLDG